MGQLGVDKNLLTEGSISKALSRADDSLKTTYPTLKPYTKPSSTASLPKHNCVLTFTDLEGEHDSVSSVTQRPGLFRRYTRVTSPFTAKMFLRASYNDQVNARQNVGHAATTRPLCRREEYQQRKASFLMAVNPRFVALDVSWTSTKSCIGQCSTVCKESFA